MTGIPDVLGRPAGEATRICRDKGLRVVVWHAAPPWPSAPGPDDRVLRATRGTAGEVELLIASESPERLPRTIPCHIAIICDGNGRWAEARGLPRSEGHRAGAERARAVVEWCSELGVSFLSLYVFSTENWRRPQGEIYSLMDLIVEGTRKGLDKLIRSGIRVRALGDVANLPGHVRQAIAQVSDATAKSGGMTVNLMLNYGGRADIVAACREIATETAAGRLRPGEVDERALADRLITRDLPDPELIIRTAGDLRLSNFLLWQSAYSEFHFSPVLWPDFGRGDLLWAIDDFSTRKRRFGGLGPEER